MFNQLVVLAIIGGNCLNNFMNIDFSGKSSSKTIVIPLKGKVGSIYPNDYIGESGWFDSQMIKELFDSAIKDKENVITIIFEIDSPGGYIYEEKNICELIQRYRDRFEFIAYPHDAFSAASTIVMTCDRLIASSDSKVGAAVAMEGNGEAVAEKFKSADASITRTFFANGNKPTVISAAFSDLKSELWYCKSKNEFAATKPDVETEEHWIQLDDSNTILTFDYQQLLECGLAEKKIDSLSPLYQDKQFENWANELNKIRKKASKAAQKLNDDFDELWELIHESIDLELLLRSAYYNQNRSEYERLYRKFRKEIAKTVIHAKNILKDIERNKYPFQISESFIGKIVAIRFNGQNVLDDPKLDCESIFRHFDEMISAYNAYVTQ